VGSGPTTHHDDARQKDDTTVTEFLLSYDRNDGDGGYVQEFFEDLSDELARRRAEWDKKTVGYLDVKVGTGSKWPERLNQALATTTAFVPLYSPRYFVSDYCGREWAVFASRVRAHERARSASADLIIPVRWESVDRSTLPAVARPLQDHDSTFPEVYRAIGLRRIVKLRKRYDLSGARTRPWPLISGFRPRLRNG
jgi:hypothetical protein